MRTRKLVAAVAVCATAGVGALWASVNPAQATGIHGKDIDKECPVHGHDWKDKDGGSCEKPHGTRPPREKPLPTKVEKPTTTKKDTKVKAVEATPKFTG